MSEDISVEFRPVPVHVVADSTKGAAAPARAPRRRADAFRTITLTAADPVRLILPPDPSRVRAWVQAGGNDAVLCASKGQAQDSANADTGLAHPQGMLLPKGNTAPWPIEGTGEVWATAAAFPTQISMTIVNESGG